MRCGIKERRLHLAFPSLISLNFEADNGQLMRSYLPKRLTACEASFMGRSSTHDLTPLSTASCSISAMSSGPPAREENELQIECEKTPTHR